MTFFDEALALGPVAYYRLGESSGTTAVDSSGNGHNATYGGSPTFGQPSLVGDADAAVRFDAADYLKIPTADAWQRTDAFTWVMVVSGWDGVSYANLVDRNDGAQSLWLGTDGRLRAFINTTSDGAGTLFDGNSASMPGTIPSPEAIHLVGVSYADPTAKSYLDGVPSPGSVLHGRGAMSGDLYLGSVPTAPNDDTVTIDEFLIFDRVLTDAEWATLAAAITTTPPTPVGTDLSFGNYGYAYGGPDAGTEVVWVPPAATPPAGAFPAATPMRRVHHVPPTLTLDDGRAVFAGFGTEVIEPWCDYIRVSIDGHDWTWFRNFQTVIGGWQNLDPYGDASLTLSFPGISEFEAPGVGDLAPLTKTSRVVLNRVVGGVIIDAQDPLFLGLVARDSFQSGPASISCDGVYMGRESRLLHQPYVLHNQARTLKEHLIREHRKIYRADFQIVSDVDGPLIGSRGDRSMTRVGYVDHLLGLSNQEDGDSYTLLPDRSIARNAMRLQLRSMASVDATVYAGAHGVKVNDFAADPATNRVYIEGQAPDGGRYRNVVYPFAGYDDDPVDYPMAGGASFGIGTTDADTIGGDGIRILTRRLWSLGLLESDDAGSSVFDAEVEDAVNEFRDQLGLPQNGTVTTGLWANLYAQGFNKQSLQGVHFEPGAAKTETVEWLRGPGGMVTEPNPNYDRKVMPVEEFVSYGENVSKRSAKKNAKATIGRTEVRTGTVVLTSDPAEMSRFELRAGMTLLVKNLLGTGATGLKLYISSVEVDWSGGSVTLAVATSALHFIELATIRQRQVEARQNPAKRARQAFRHSGQVHDPVLGWDADGPSGIVRRRMLQAGQWNPIQVIACERGTLAEMRFVADNPTPFMVMVFGQKVNAGVLNRVIGNPFTWRGVDSGRSFGDGVTTSGSTTVTSGSANFVSNDEGRTVTGAGVPAGTTVSEVVNTSTIHLSQAATSSGSGVSLTLGDFTQDRESTFSAHAEWLLKRLLSQAYGDPEEPGGYYPRRHTNDKGETTNHPATGVLYDDASQSFVTQACLLWVYVWPLEDTMFHGRMKLVPED